MIKYKIGSYVIHKNSFKTYPDRYSYEILEYNEETLLYVCQDIKTKEIFKNITRATLDLYLHVDNLELMSILYG